jgi:hypothetical protein
MRSGTIGCNPDDFAQIPIGVATRRASLVGLPFGVVSRTLKKFDLLKFS